MTITEVSKVFGLSPDTLRYYERIGLIPEVNRSKGGVRVCLQNYFSHIIEAANITIAK